MRVAPTGLGCKGGVFFAAVMLAYYATPYSNLFFLLTAFLAVLGLLGLAGAVGNLRGIGCSVAAAPPSAQGGRHEVQLRLDCGARARFDLQIAIETDGVRRRALAVPSARGVEVRSGHVEGLPRGVHPVHAVIVSSRHPFGIARASRRFGVTAELVVHPAPADLRDAARGGLDEDGNLLRTGGDDAVAGLRPWRDGDSLRAVHWKATARRGEPVLKEFERQTGDGIEVVLDRRAGPAEFEAALSLCAALVLFAQENERPLRLCSQQLDEVYGSGHAEFAAALRWLALATPLPQHAPAPPVAPAAIRLPRRGAEVARV